MRGMSPEKIHRRAEEERWNRIVPFVGREEIVIDGIGPCLGIIIFSRTRQAGLWGHFTQPIFYSEEELEQGRKANSKFATFTDFIDLSRLTPATEEDYVVVAAGMSPNPIEPGFRADEALCHIENVASRRRVVGKILKDNFPAERLDLHLPEKLCLAMRMRFDPASGRVNVQRFRLYHLEFTPEFFLEKWLAARRLA